MKYSSINLFCFMKMLDKRIYLHILVSNMIPYQMLFASFKSNKTGVTSGEGTDNPPGAALEFTIGF